MVNRQSLKPGMKVTLYDQGSFQRGLVEVVRLRYPSLDKNVVGDVLLRDSSDVQMWDSLSNIKFVNYQMVAYNVNAD